MNQSTALLYKCFSAGRTALYIALAMVFLAPTALASAPYTVEGVKVDVTAESALAARDQAFAKAQADAFTILAKNILPPERLAGFSVPGPAVLAGMIRDYEITEEKLSRTRYSGTYTFRFKEGPVHRYLGVMSGEPELSSTPGYNPYGAGAPMGEQAQVSLLLIPFYQSGWDMLLWSPDNIWMQTWNESMRGGSSLIAVPIGDVLDVNDIGDNQALTYDRQKLKSMTARYGAGEAVLAVAIPGMPQQDALTVNIYRTDRGGPELAHRIFISGMGKSPATVMSEAVSRTREALRGGWKGQGEPEIAAPAVSYEPQPAQTPVAGNYLGSARFANLQEWAQLQRDISRIPGVSRVVIQSLSPREAILEISYDGDVGILRRELEIYRVTLAGYESPPPAAVPQRPTIPYNQGFYTRPAYEGETFVQPIIRDPEPRPQRNPSSYINNF